jgi:4-amino-4-deoxy-L-arabinose transferase-like glycosyltransferase
LSLAQIATQAYRIRLSLAFYSVTASLLIWREAGTRSSGEPVNDIVALWLSAMAAAVIAVAGAPSGATWRRTWQAVQDHRREVVGAGALTIAALLIRVFPWGSHPRTMSGDEGVFALQALEVQAGNLNNYFAVVNTGNINFTFAVLAGVMSVAGETVGGSRLFSAFLGALAIIPTYALARLHFGKLVATLSAVLLATSYFALFWSRNTMNEASAFVFAPATLWLLDQGLLGRRRMPALLAGFAVGLSLLFYSSNRILMPIALLYVAYAVCAARPRSLQQARTSIIAVLPFAAIGMAGFLVSAMPILSHFWHVPGSFNHRANQVSIFTSGWLDREVDLRGDNALLILLDQFQTAAMAPFANETAGTFIHRDPPLLGWPVALPTAIGLAIITITFWRRQHFGIAAGFWATAAGTAITIGPGEAHKLVTSISILAILTAVGVVGAARVLQRLTPMPNGLVLAGAFAMSMVVVLWNLNFYFEDPDRDAVYSDPNTQIAQSIAGQANSLGDGTTVYLLGAPWMSYGGYGNLRFIARDATGIDMNEPLTASTPAPDLTGPTLFAVLGGRQEELDIIRGWFPNGVEARHTWPDWGYLYSTYTVYPQVTDDLAIDDP